MCPSANFDLARPPRHVRSSAGVTVLEWLMLLTLCGAFGAILFAGSLREETVKDASRIRTELEEIERALIVSAEENSWEDGREVSFEELKPEIRTKFKRLRKTGSDVLGHTFGPFEVGLLPGVPAESFRALDGKIADGYWEPYGVAGEETEAIHREFSPDGQ